MKRIQHNQWKERGMVSILVTMLLMIVISLIVLGFAQISRRNQRQATDRQLSTQAFYAAEAGINDARDLIKTALSSGAAIPAKTDCTLGSGPAASFYGGLNASLDTANNVSYSCLMVDPSPTELVYDGVTSKSTVVPLTSTSGAPISSVNLQVITKDTTTTPATGCPTTVNFPNTTAWGSSGCGFGVLRFDIVPTTGNFNATSLQDRTMTSFLVPQRTGGVATVAYPAATPASTNGNNRIAMQCSGTSCNMRITGLNVNQYYLRVSSIYKDVKLVVTARDSTNTVMELNGAQAVIDATGKAQDVLRRVQVRVPLTPLNNDMLSDYALETTDAICKRYVTMDGYFQSYAASAVSGLTTGPPANPLCQ